MATESLAAADNTSGFDDGEVDLLYRVELIGREDLSITGVGALIKRAAGLLLLKSRPRSPWGPL